MNEVLLDSNVLLRHFLQDIPSQSKKATAIIAEVEKVEKIGLLSILVVNEIIWILRGHVHPTAAAKLAKEANVKKLILTHFDASRYTSLKQRKIAKTKAQKIFPNTIAAVDDMTIRL